VNQTDLPLEPTAADAQAAIREEFAFFSDWAERYQYLIDLGRKLPEFPEEWKTEEHRLHGCQSMVWIVAEGDASRLDFRAISDSAIVSGLVYLALRVRQAGVPGQQTPGFIRATSRAQRQGVFGGEPGLDCRVRVPGAGLPGAGDPAVRPAAAKSAAERTCGAGAPDAFQEEFYDLVEVARRLGLAQHPAARARGGVQWPPAAPGLGVPHPERGPGPLPG